jgi:preprotein translocase subunit SecE
LVEHWSPKPGVGSSSLSARANKQIDMEKLTNFFESVIAEFKKVSWPTQQELIDNTIIVVVFSIILSAFIFGIDQVYSTVLEAIYR